jgi:hypothetical protein
MDFPQLLFPGITFTNNSFIHAVKLMRAKIPFLTKSWRNSARKNKFSAVKLMRAKIPFLTKVGAKKQV